MVYKTAIEAATFVSNVMATDRKNSISVMIACSPTNLESFTDYIFSAIIKFSMTFNTKSLICSIRFLIKSRFNHNFNYALIALISTLVNGCLCPCFL